MSFDLLAGTPVLVAETRRPPPAWATTGAPFAFLTGCEDQGLPPVRRDRPRLAEPVDMRAPREA